MKTLFSYLFYFLGIPILFTITSCEETSDGGGFNSFTLDSLNIHNYPKIDGSTSAHPLQMLIACKLLEVDYYWGTSWLDETYRIYPRTDEKPEVAQFIYDSMVHNGTHGSYENLIRGKADIILVARTASEDELELADSANVSLITKPVALDAFVFIANINNPVNSLTTKQIQDIYTGEIIRWNEVGGTDSLIHPYQRNANSGSQELMLSLVMKDLQILDLPEMILIGMMGPINVITYDHDGLGYTVYFFEQFMAPNDSLKLLAVEGTRPDSNTLKNKSYKYTTEVYVVIRDDLNVSSSAYQLYRWLLLEEGQAVVEESGYIPYY